MKICSLLLISIISLFIACNSESQEIIVTVTPINEEITSTSTPIPTIPVTIPTQVTTIPTAIPTAIPTPYSTQTPQSKYPTAECVDGTKSYNVNPWDGTTCSNNGGISMYLEKPGSENSSGNYSYTPTPTPTR